MGDRKDLFILEDFKEFFYNDLYLILYNKKFIIYLFVKQFYQIISINNQCMYFKIFLNEQKEN